MRPDRGVVLTIVIIIIIIIIIIICNDVQKGVITNFDCNYLSIITIISKDSFNAYYIIKKKDAS